MRGLRRARDADQRGAAAVEFALVVVPFITLVFGAIDFGWAIDQDVLVNNAAREGAREGSLNPDAADVEAIVRSSLSHVADDGATVAVSCRQPSGDACSLAGAAPGDTVVVTVSVDHDWVTPLGQVFAPGGITLSKTAEMRIE